MMLLPLWAIFGSILVSYYNGVRWSPVVGGGGVGGGGGGLVVANLHYYRHTNTHPLLPLSDNAQIGSGLVMSLHHQPCHCHNGTIIPRGEHSIEK